MKRRTRVLSVLGVLLALGVVAAWQWEFVLRVGDSILSTYATHYVRTVTTALPHCDRVEIFHLDGNTFFGDGAARLKPGEGFHTDAYGGGEDKILGHVTLHGEEAEAFASLWRAQKFDWGLQKLCHSPVCGLQFYSGRKLTFQTTVCFHCSNFYVTVPLVGTGWWGFDADSPQSRDLVRRLWVFFPDAKPK